MAPLPFLVAGRRTFAVFYLSDTDPALDGLDLDYIGPQRDVGVAEFHLATSVKMGAPNDEVLHGHPLWGYGLELYGAHVVVNSPWIRELMDIKPGVRPVQREPLDGQAPLSARLS